MKNVVICDHCQVEELTSLHQGLAHYGHTVVPSTHEDPVEVYNDIVGMCTRPTPERPRPDVVVTDMMDEMREQSIPVAEWWGCRLVGLLRQDPNTANIRIMPRTRYPNAALHQYLNGQGIPSGDIIVRYATSIKRIAEKIDR